MTECSTKEYDEWNRKGLVSRGKERPKTKWPEGIKNEKRALCFQESNRIKLKIGVSVK